MQTVEPPETAPLASDTEPTWEETEQILERVENTMFYVGLGARAVAYGVLVVLANRSPLALQFLTGVFVADLAVRTVTGLLELRERRYALLLEVALFVVVGHLWSGAGGSILPPDPEGRAIAMLGFLLVFSGRGSLFTWKLLHPD